MSLRHAVIVLGAGASKGARVSGGKTPPLDADFLTAAAAYFRGKQARGTHKEAVRAWTSFKSHLKSAGLDFKEVKDWRLEQLSTFLEARSSLQGLQLGRGRPREFKDALDALKILVCHVLRAEGGTRPCELHQRLFEHVRPSAVLSFNYDLIADQSMLQSGLLDWRTEQYRGATHAEVPTEKGSKYIRVSATPGNGEIPLLKLHGSMNWEKKRRGDGYRLSGCHLPGNDHVLLDYQRVPEKPYIVPPVAAKIQIAQQALRGRWRSAVHHLHDAPSWIIWGYSFPATDTISQVLFRTALTRNRKSKPVLVVNPDASVAGRVQAVCRKVKVRYYPSIERLLLDEGVLDVLEDDQ
jgi:hypothetical protein